MRPSGKFRLLDLMSHNSAVEDTSLPRCTMLLGKQLLTFHHQCQVVQEGAPANVRTCIRIQSLQPIKKVEQELEDRHIPHSTHEHPVEH